MLYYGKRLANRSSIRFLRDERRVEDFGAEGRKRDFKRQDEEKEFES